MGDFENWADGEEKKGTRTKFNRCINLIENDPAFKNLFRFNLMSGYVEFENAPGWDLNSKIGDSLKDRHLISIRAILAKKYNFTCSKGDIDDAVINEAMKKSYHPIKQYIEGLKWDGIERLDFWMIELCGAEDNAYIRAVSRKLLIACCARIYDPGCQWDYLTILEGAQGTYKTTMLRALGGKWYASINFNSTDKELAEAMRGHWILEVEEFAGFNKQESRRMRSVISKRTDTLRMAYDRHADDYQRQCVMIATTNPEGDNRIFIDTTGNRNGRRCPLVVRGFIRIRLFDGVARFVRG